MKTKNLLCLIITVGILGSQVGCAIQGTQSLSPGGITFNRSVRLGLDAFKPNPFEKPKRPLPREEPVPIINNHYYEDPCPRPRYSFQTYEPQETHIVIW